MRFVSCILLGMLFPVSSLYAGEEKLRLWAGSQSDAVRRVLTSDVYEGEDCDRFLAERIALAKEAGPVAAILFKGMIHYHPPMLVWAHEGKLDADISLIKMYNYGWFYSGVLFARLGEFPAIPDFDHEYAKIVEQERYSNERRIDTETFMQKVESLRGHLVYADDPGVVEYQECSKHARSYAETQQCLSNLATVSALPEWSDLVDELTKGTYQDGCELKIWPRDFETTGQAVEFE